MKGYLTAGLCLFVFFMLTLNIGAIAQVHYPGNLHLDSLRKLAERMTQSGIYERNIPLGHVGSPDKADPKMPMQIRQEHTYMYMRFAFDPADIDPVGGYITGKVFIGERYIESDYRRKKEFGDTPTLNNLEKDKHGTDYHCKLYYDRKNLEYRVNIYPDYSVNICKKGKHFNGGKKWGCSAYCIHDKTIKEMIKIPDCHYSDFMKNDRAGELFYNWGTEKLNEIGIKEKAKRKMTRAFNKYNFFKSSSLVSTKGNYKRIKIINDWTHRINLSKYIKCFSLVSSDSNGIYRQLQLAFTKYSLSDDLLDHHRYVFDFVEYEELEKRNSDDTTYTYTENSWYKILMESEFPDDLPHLNDRRKSEIKQFYLKGNTPIYLDQDKRLEESKKRISKIEIKKINDSLANGQERRTILVSDLKNKSNAKDSLQNVNQSINGGMTKLSDILVTFRNDSTRLKGELLKNRSELKDQNTIISQYLPSVPDSVIKSFNVKFKNSISVVPMIEFDIVRLDSLLKTDVDSLISRDLAIAGKKFIDSGVIFKNRKDDVIKISKTNASDIDKIEIKQDDLAQISKTVKDKLNVFFDRCELFVKSYKESIDVDRKIVLKLGEIRLKKDEADRNIKIIDQLDSEIKSLLSDSIKLVKSIDGWKADSVRLNNSGAGNSDRNKASSAKKWVFYKKYPKDSTYAVNKLDFIKFWEGNLNNRIPVRDRIPWLDTLADGSGSERLYLRGGISDIYHVRYGKPVEAGAIVRVKSKLKLKREWVYVIDKSEVNWSEQKDKIEDPVFIDDKNKVSRLEYKEVKSIQHKDGYCYYWIGFEEKRDKKE